MDRTYLGKIFLSFHPFGISVFFQLILSILFFLIPGGKKKETVEQEPDPDEPPPALEVDIKIKMHRWSSTKESMEAEE